MAQGRSAAPIFQQVLARQHVEAFLNRRDKYAAFAYARTIEPVFLNRAEVFAAVGRASPTARFAVDRVVEGYACALQPQQVKSL